MGWARIDDGFDDHPKVLALLEEEQGAAAVGLWTLCLTYAHRTTRKAGKMPGAIPAALPRRYLGAIGRELALLLVKVGLWDEAAEGWLIHDFGDYLPSEETRLARAEAGRRGAAKRWGGNDEAEPKQDDDNAMASDSNLPSGSHDVDSNAVASDGSRAPAHRDPVPVPVPEELPKTSSSVGAKTEPAKRGRRIPVDFTVTPEMVAWANEHCPGIDGRTETQKFVNYWRSATGKGATKLDWELTWQNWLLNARDRYGAGARASPNGAKPSTTDIRVNAILALKETLPEQQRTLPE
jgi:hypothetical protein